MTDAGAPNPVDANPATRIAVRLRRLYGDESATVMLPAVHALVERWRAHFAEAPPTRDAGRTRPRLDAAHIVLIAYGDHLQRPGEAPLATLGDWCRAHLRGCISTVHVLPFHPSTSYEGYAISDYRAVDPALGGWRDLERLNGDFDLMMDFVLNHCSASHPWFRQFLADQEPGRRYFLTLPDPETPWLRGVARARNSPLLHPFSTRNGVRHVWTTYSPDLIDLEWREPTLCLEMLDILLDMVAHGARMIRLDAFVYVWKRAGTSCVNQPENHELIGLFQDVLAAAGCGATAILPSITNVSQAENYAYFPERKGARKADLIYHLPLSALLLHALYAHDAGTLTRWLRDLPPAPPGCAYLNLAATHDGVGLTWLKGILPEAEVQAVIAAAVARGAMVSSRRPTCDAEAGPWEINTTWFSACAPEAGESASCHVERFLATQSVVLALRGVPAMYLPLFLAGVNDSARVAATGDARAINRGRFDAATWEAAAAVPDSPQAAVLQQLPGLLRVRGAHAAFDPAGAQVLVDTGQAAVLGILRIAPDGGERVLCLTNFGRSVVCLPEPLAGVTSDPDGRVVRQDLITGETMPSGPLTLRPYQVLWLRERPPSGRPS